MSTFLTTMISAVTRGVVLTSTLGAQVKTVLNKYYAKLRILKIIGFKINQTRNLPQIANQSHLHLYFSSYKYKNNSISTYFT